ncbi:hypothetical protein [Planktothrix sp. FACHB-1365]|uniref:hypothetical protein n=1 Tax=Planktothrix sp. FACHB-1365 TaxID=2692855 RepID=UPI001689E14F|nr:hypothetical protein [Planktothrix sp. FACHB-1365]MBD2481545.1 hypothetical protein [Planktothrix sp. FACHB-1365]
MIGNTETYQEIADIFLIDVDLDQPEDLIEQAFIRARIIEKATVKLLNFEIDVQTFLDIVEPCQDDMDNFLSSVESKIENINLLCTPIQ